MDEGYRSRETVTTCYVHTFDQPLVKRDRSKTYVVRPRANLITQWQPLEWNDTSDEMRTIFEDRVVYHFMADQVTNEVLNLKQNTAVLTRVLATLMWRRGVEL
jgi:hypothetical protein